MTGGGGGSNANTLGLVIRELRLRGNSLQPELDEYIELFNTTSNNITVTTTDGSAGWAVAAGNTSTILFTIPNNTVIPAKGHYLLVNNSTNGYSLGTPGDATYTTDIVDDSGVAVFNTSNSANFNATTIIDAVGWQSSDPFFSEGIALPNLGTTNGEYAWVRQMQNGIPVDTNNNASDFMLVSPAGVTINGVTAQIGAPGPANQSQTVEMNSQIIQSLFDPNMATSAHPNQVRDTMAIPNGTFGTLARRRSYTNNSGARLQQVRFRLIDITNAAAGTEADLRMLNSVTATIDGKTVEGLTITPTPAQPNGGGLNSLFVVGTDLPIGATINIEFKLGVMRKGKYRFILNIEAAP